MSSRRRLGVRVWLHVLHLGQRLSAEREHGNAEDRFAIAGGEGRYTNE